MALEQRGGGLYYYTSRRVGGRVVKRYVGRGQCAVLASRLDALDRDRREQAAFDRRADLNELREQNAALREWLAAVDGVVAAALGLAGWHRVRRQWRRRRGATVGTLARIEQLPWVSPELLARAGEIDPATVEKAGKGDKAALQAVDEYLDNPAAMAFWGDLGRHVLAKWVEQYAGKNVVMRRAMPRFASDMRARLAGPDPNPLNLLLAEQVVLAWLFASWSDYQYAGTVGELQPKQGEFHLKRIALAHRNLMSACRTLAKVRRASLPDVLALVNVNPPARPN